MAIFKAKLSVLQELFAKNGPPSGARVKGANPALKKSSNIPEIYAKMFGRLP